MIEQGFIVGLIVLCIWYTMQEDEIFYFINKWIWKQNWIPSKLHNPIFECNVCMSPWYGSAIYWIMPWSHTILYWPIVILIAMGFNILFNRL